MVDDAEYVRRRDPVYIEKRLIEIEHESTQVVPNVLADAEKRFFEAESSLARAEGKLTYPPHVKNAEARRSFSEEKLPNENMEVLVCRRALTYAKALSEGLRREADSLRSRLSFAKTELTGRN